MRALQECIHGVVGEPAPLGGWCSGIAQWVVLRVDVLEWLRSPEVDERFSSIGPKQIMQASIGLFHVLFFL